MVDQLVRPHQLKILLSDDEKGWLETIVQAKGLTSSDCIRQFIRSAYDQVVGHHTASSSTAFDVHALEKRRHGKSAKKAKKARVAKKRPAKAKRAARKAPRAKKPRAKKKGRR